MVSFSLYIDYKGTRIEVAGVVDSRFGAECLTSFVVLLKPETPGGGALGEIVPPMSRSGRPR
jgi:hypothetical protein